MNQQAIQKEILIHVGEIIAIYPQYSFSQHLCNILRSKGKDPRTYHWDDQKLLKEIEKYREELVTDLAESKDEDEDDF